MTPTDEDLLSAYLDGATSPADAKRVEELLARDPALADELQRLHANDRLLRASIMAAVPDEANEAALRQFGIALPHAAANDNIKRWAWPALGAVAAALGLLVVIHPLATSVSGKDEPFSRAMEVTPSLQAASLPDGARISPVLTFAAGDGRFCREFRLSGRLPAQNREGIACRNRRGAWDTIALAAPSGELQKSDRIEVAEGADSPALDLAYRRLGGSDPFSATRERQLIERHWSEKIPADRE